MSSFIPSLIALGSGASRKGNCSISPNRRYFMRNITEARFVRMISGSVNSGLDSKSLSA